MPRCRSDLPYWALLQYAVRGESAMSVHSRDVRAALKNNGVVRGAAVTALAAQRIRANIDGKGVLQDCFSPGVFLVPMPRSAPLVDGALWPGGVICEALVRAGVGAGVAPCLRRCRAVRKSALAGPGERPGVVDHYESMCCDPAAVVGKPTGFILVDDIVTRGATLSGAALRMREAFPAAPLFCFAVMRAISAGDVETVLAPVSGQIMCWPSGKLHREP